MQNEHELHNQSRKVLWRGSLIAFYVLAMTIFNRKHSPNLDPISNGLLSWSSYQLDELQQSLNSKQKDLVAALSELQILHQEVILLTFSHQSRSCVFLNVILEVMAQSGHVQICSEKLDAWIIFHLCLKLGDYLYFSYGDASCVISRR